MPSEDALLAAMILAAKADGDAADAGESPAVPAELGEPTPKADGATTPPAEAPAAVPKPEGTPAPAPVDKALLTRAIRAGIPYEEAHEYSPKALAKIVELAERTPAAATATQPKVEATPGKFVLDTADLDPAVAKVLNAMNEHYAARQAEAKPAAKPTPAPAAPAAAPAAGNFEKALDASFEALQRNDLYSGDEGAARRHAVLAVGSKIAADNESAGREQTMAEIIAAAHAKLFGGPKPAVHPALGSTIARPTRHARREEAPPAPADEDEAAIEVMRGLMKKA